MSEKSTEQELEVLKEDVYRLLKTMETTLKKKLDTSKACSETVVQKVKEKIETFPRASAVVAGTLVLGIGYLAVQLWKGRNR